jgi:hypothetical protein
MSIVKLAHKTGNFTTLMNETLQDPRIKPGALGVLVYLLSKPQDWQARQTEVQRHFGIGQTACATIFNELIELGYVVRTVNRTKNGSFDQWVYTVHERPVSVSTTTRLPATGSPATGSPASGQPDTTKERTNKIKKEQNKTSSSSSDDGRALSMENQFEGIWQSYPRKVGKQAAFRAFQARRREGIAVDLLAQAVRNYADLRRGQDQKFTMHASTFFGPDKKFEDYLDGGAAFEVDKSLTAEGWFEQRRQRNAVDRG